MKFSYLSVATIAAALVLPVAGCGGNGPYYRQNDEARYRGDYRASYGVVEGIDYVQRNRGAPSGIGAVVGGVAGGVLGHQIGGGIGNTAATIAGAIGGAVVGNEVEKRNPRDDEDFRVTVRMDDGTYRSVIMPDEPHLRPGDRVSVDNGRLYRR